MNPTELRREMSSMVRLAFPITLAQLSLVTMGLVDVAIVGRTTVDDLAAVSLGRSIMFTAMSFAMGVSFALEPLASQAVGAGERDQAWATFRNALVAGVLVSVPVLLLALAATWALAPLGITPEVVSGVRWYLIGHTPGLFAFVAFLCAKTFLQAHGDARPAVIAAVIANVVNAAACALLVWGDGALTRVGLPALGLPALGTFGAGIATSLGSMVLAGVILNATRRYRPAVRVTGPTATRIFSLGLPVGLQILAEIGVFSVVALMAGRLGPAVVSAHQIALGLASFTFMGALGVAGATAARVGNTIGAGQSPRLAGFAGFGLSAMVAGVGALAFSLFPRTLAAIFTDDPAIIDAAVSLLSIAALFQLFDCLQAVAAGALRGAADMRYPFVANVIAHWGLGFPTAIVFCFGFGLGARGLWWGLTAGLVAVSILLVRRFAKIADTPIERV